MLFGKDVEVWH